MRLFETEAVVLRRKKVTAYDSYLTLFTRELGRIEVFAKGANFPKNANNKGAQPFVYGLFTLSGQKSFSLSSVEVKHNFYSLREDYEKLLTSSFLTRVLLDILEERESQKSLFELYVNALSIIEKFPDVSSCLSLYFFGRIAHLMGIKPHVENCLICSKKEADYYDAASGGFFCEEHRESHWAKRQDLREIYQRIYTTPLVPFLNASKEIRCEDFLSDLEHYLETHLGINMHRLRQEFESYS